MARRIERLFDKYAADLRRFIPSLEDHFGCPLCMQAYPRTDALTDVLAEEHVISSKLGGRLVTLTCRQCNNTLGSKLESQLVRRVRTDAGQSPFAMRMEVGGTVQRGELHIPRERADAFQLKIIDKQTDRRETEKFERLVPNGLGEIKLSFTGGYGESQTLVALVRSAYLLMFHIFGYRYVFDPSAELIRAQIADPLAETGVLNGVRWKLNATLPAETRVWVVKEPQGFRSLLVVLQLNREPAHAGAVTLPLPGDSGAALFAGLAMSPPRQIVVGWQLLAAADRFHPYDAISHLLDEDRLDGPPDPSATLHARSRRAS